jgi:hypothetical protein
MFDRFEMIEALHVILFDEEQQALNHARERRTAARSSFEAFGFRLRVPGDCFRCYTCNEVAIVLVEWPIGHLGWRPRHCLQRVRHREGSHQSRRCAMSRAYNACTMRGPASGRPGTV